MNGISSDTEKQYQENPEYVKFLTVAQVADRYGVSPSYVRAHLTEFGAIRLPGRVYRIPLSALGVIEYSPTRRLRLVEANGSSVLERAVRADRRRLR